MASGPPSLPTLYKHQLRSLNPNLPQVIEHLVEVDILTRTEASKVVSTSDQFNRLCQLLASKGADRKSTILSEIESFRGSLQEPTDRHLREGSAPHHHKHMYVLGKHVFITTFYTITICSNYSNLLRITYMYMYGYK